MNESLKEHGLRLTPQRVELLKVLDKMGRHHPSFSEVYEMVKRKYANVSQSTILNNMTAMVDIGLIQRFSYKGETRYELNPKPHVNFIDSSGAIIDIENVDITRLVAKLLELINSSTGVKTKRILILAE